ncbi:MAG: arginine repressor [Clostridiales bacterium]|nr:arginine repressor [Clostridiales bacterium]
MKSGRQEKIISLVERCEIETQEELIGLLEREGYRVTQATVSRDIKELKLSKIPTGRGTYKYTLPKHDDGSGSLKFNSALIESIKKVDYSGNIIVLSTYPGLANAVAAGLDAIETNEILGSVAGDDTIFIVTRGLESSKSLSERIKILLKTV